MKEKIITILKKIGYFLLVWGRPIARAKAQEILIPTLDAKMKEKGIADNVRKDILDVLQTYLVKII